MPLELNTKLVLVRKKKEEIKSILVFIVLSARNENEQKWYDDLKFFFDSKKIKIVENTKIC